MALGTNLTFYTSLSKGLKLKVRKFWGLIPTFVEVTGEHAPPAPTPPPPILNRVKIYVIGLHNLISMNIFFTIKDHTFSS